MTQPASETPKDTIGALMLGVAAVVLIILLMHSMVILGQNTGEAMRARFEMPVEPNTQGQPAAQPGAIVTSSREGVPVLTYHYFRGRTGPLRLMRILGAVLLSMPLMNDMEIWTQSAAEFEREMAYLFKHGYETITLDELTAWQRGERTLPERCVVITFDDGDRSVYEHAFPVLRKYGFQATFFVVTSQIGRQWQGVDNLTWRELRKMHDSGVFVIESHTHDLHYKVGTDDQRLPVFLAASRGEHEFAGAASWQDGVLADLEQSRRSIQENIGWKSRYLAWPYGMRNDAVDSLATVAGFERACSLRPGPNPLLEDLSTTAPHSSRLPLSSVEVKRYRVSARTSVRLFKLMVSGNYHPVDP